MELMVAGRHRISGMPRPDFDPSAWTGVDTTTDRPVLVCLATREMGVAARKRREVAHPRLVPIVDVVSVRDGVEPPLEAPDPRGETFVVLEATTGATLEEIVRLGGAFDATTAVDLALGIADALVTIHAAGAFHGGVSPLAIEVLDGGGGVRLALAGIQDAALAYQSPNRLCEEGGLSVHDDAWALLACLYFAVSGSAAFQGETAAAVARRVLGGRPLPIRANAPPEQDLQKMFDRGFSRTGKRYPDVLALRDELRAWAEAHAPALAEKIRAEEAGRPPPLPPPLPVAASLAPPPNVAPAASMPPPAQPSVPPEARPPSLASLPPPAPRAPAPAPPAPPPEASAPIAATPATPPAAGGRAILAVAAALVAIGAAVVVVMRPSPGTPAPAPPSPPATTQAAAPAPKHAPPPATTAAPLAASASAAPGGDLDACIDAWFPPASFDPDTDLSFVCTEHDGRHGVAKLHRAILAGGRGKKITEAMKEWGTFGWFELPVYATLRARCCPGAPPIEVPHVQGSSCTSPRDTIQALGVATAHRGDVSAAIRAFRKNVSCLVEVGDYPAYGREGAIGTAEEPAFRAFAARGPGR